ncbi:hypothetical protein LSG31_13995 [Fodinisporobacter ferrooxydans]|uniref:Glycosyltransferase RgtA/B/C/D-like domain-containing protein n=1 Tax=Fodinisporobacter ferrooxydans TaxID=2901836 RepID=A0ABY4CES6_9BACL|nr:hypothetical protein LSG31_13995 [Alicyclobacillaceae bacterium MYW30-H2]
MLSSYSSLQNQLYHSSHFAFALLVLMVIVPRFIFTQTSSDRLEQFFSNFLRIILLYIIIGYVLVLTKLFEVLSIFVTLALIASSRYLRPSSTAERERIFQNIAVNFYNFLDAGFFLRDNWKKWRKMNVMNETFKITRANMHTKLVLPIVILFVFACSAYLRFYDSWMYAAPGMADGYVTLAWMKYIDARILFHDGIYPQGYDIVLSYLHKFAAIDALYVLKYAGPLNGILTMLGFYFVFSRLFKNSIAGIIAIAVYGLAGAGLFGDDWMRQASTNSQEFAFVFIFPTLYFSLRYAVENRRSDLINVFAGWTIIGLVHSIGYAFVSLGIGLIMLLIVLTQANNGWKTCLHLAGAGGISLVISLLPLIIGLLMHKELHQSSEKFLLGEVNVSPPHLHIWDMIGLSALFLILACSVVCKKTKTEQLYDRFAILFGILIFLLYEFGPSITHSEVLEARSRSLWVLTILFVIGVGWKSFWYLTEKLPYQKWIQLLVSVGLICLLIQSSRFQPIIPYKMEWESGVEQYLRIASLHPNKTWVIFSHNEGYDLALGKGYQQFIETLLKDYDPSQPGLTRFGQMKRDRNIPNNIYIYEEKNVFQVSKHNSIYPVLEKEYKKREQEMAQLKKWIHTYETHNKDLQTFYDDPNLRIYSIHVPETKQERQRKIWGH